MKLEEAMQCKNEQADQEQEEQAPAEDDDTWKGEEWGQVEGDEIEPPEEEDMAGEADDATEGSEATGFLDVEQLWGDLEDCEYDGQVPGGQESDFKSDSPRSCEICRPITVAHFWNFGEPLQLALHCA